MARNNDDDELDFEDEDESAYEDEDEDGYDDEDEDDEDDEEDDEEGSGSGGGARRAILFTLLGLTLVGGGAYAAMSQGIEIPFLSGLMPATEEAAQPSQAAAPAVPPPAPAAAPAQTATQAAVAVPPVETAPRGELPPAGSPEKPVPVAARPVPAADQPAPVAAKAPPAVAPVARSLVKPPAQAATSATSLATARTADKTGRAARKARALRVAKGDRGVYTVQAGAFNVPENAQAVVQRLKSKGLPATRTGTGTRGKWSLWSNYVDTSAKAKALVRQFRKAGVRGQVVSRDGRFVVFLGSHPTEERAKAAAGRLSTKGLYASVHGIPATATAGPNRVWVGRFSSRMEAEAMASRVRAAVGFGIVRRL
ncbi:MAG: SPOR domain-containing protein [Candidatus Sericytochromatia bacterium]|nr:SPOR domain-containing protein [Candidatus Sericytochromatia bacterium]